MKKREDNIVWKSLVIFQRTILIITCILATVITFGAAFSRLPFVGRNFAGFEELLVIVAFWMYMIGSAYGSYEKSQITADILAINMKEGLPKSIITVIRSLATLVLGLVFLSWAWRMFNWSLFTGAATPVYRIPVTVGQSSILVGLALSSFYHAVYFYDEVKRFIAKHIKKYPAEQGGGAQ